MAHFVKGWQRRHRGEIIRRTLAGSFVAEVNRDNRRKRNTLPTLEAARAWLDEQMAGRDEQGAIALRITARQTRDALDAFARIKGAGLNASLLEAADFYLAHHKATRESWTVADCMARQLADMASPESGGSPARARSIKSKRNRLRSFIALHGGRKVVEITQADVADWLDATGARNQNLRNYRSEVQGLFNFAEKRMPGGYRNTVAKFPRARRKEITPATITDPAHVAAVLHRLEALAPRAALAFALGCFAGLRTAEITGKHGVEWQHVDFRGRRIVIPATVAKARARREVKITDNLLAWLTRYREPKGRVSITEANLNRHRRAACKALGITLPSNAARHSFGTYYAKLHGYSAAADQMGHVGGIGIFMKHYSGICTPEDAAAFFDIRPAEAAPVIRYPAAVNN